MKIQKHPTSPMYMKNGNPVFRYLVTGTKAELEDYQKVKDQFFKDGKCPIDETSKLPIFLSSDRYPAGTELRKFTNKEGKLDYVANEDEIRAFAALVKKHGIDVAKYFWEQEKGNVNVENNQELGK